MNYNQVIIAGHMTRDPELRYTPKGTAIASFALAVNRTWKTEEGEKKEEVAFIECSAWAKAAETIAQYVHKGENFFVSGRLKMETWNDKQTGANRSKLVVVVETFQFLNRAPATNATSAPSEAPPSRSPVSDVPSPRPRGITGVANANVAPTATPTNVDGTGAPKTSTEDDGPDGGIPF